MSKVFGSSVEASFFRFLSRIWDSLPQRDRDAITEYWRGLIRGTSDEYLQILQAQAEASVRDINPYTTRKWRVIPISETPDLTDLESSGLTESGPSVFRFYDGNISYTQTRSTPQALAREFRTAAADPVAFEFGFDAEFGGLDSAGAVVFGYFDDVQDLGSGVGICFGRLNEAVMEDVVRESEGEYFFDPSAAVVSGTGDVVSTRHFRSGDSFTDIDVDSGDWVLRLRNSFAGNNVSVGIVGVISVSAPADTLVLDTDLTIESGLDFSIFRRESGGVLDSGGSGSVRPEDPLQQGQVLQGLVLSGGQIGVAVSAATYTSLLLHLAQISDPQAVFQVLVSPDNTPGSYTELTRTTIVSRGGGWYEIRFSEFGWTAESGTWLKIRPVDEDVVYEISVNPYPVRISTRHKRLVRDWAAQTQALDPVQVPATARVCVVSSDGLSDHLILSEPISDLDLSQKHSYRLEVGDSEIAVVVDGITRYTAGFETGVGRRFRRVGISSVPGSDGLSVRTSSWRYSVFDIPEDVVAIPALYDKFETQELVLEQDLDYSIPSSGLLYIWNKGIYRDYDYLVAEYVVYASTRIQDLYGSLIGVSGSDSPELKLKVAAVWSSLLEGPVLESIRKGVEAFAGLPVTLYPGFVTAEPTADGIEIDGEFIPFPVGVGPAINPRTGKVFAVGDYVPAFTAVAAGVRVKDIYSDRNWWVDAAADSTINPLQRYHVFEVEIDDQVFGLVEPADVNAFLDRIKRIGDNYVVVAVVGIDESLVVESWRSRAQALDQDQNLVFVGDSSDNARVFTPYFLPRIWPETFGFGVFGDISHDQALNQTGTGGSGFGAPDQSFLDRNVVVAAADGAASADVFTSSGSAFVSAGVSSGDVLEFAAGGSWVVVEVLSQTQLRVNVSTQPLPQGQTGISFEIARYVSAADPAQAFVVLDSIRIRFGAVLRIRVDDYEEVSVVVGTKPNDPVLGAAEYDVDEVVSALTFSSGKSKIPGARVYAETIGIDPRDFDAVVGPPRRLVIESVSTKGFNSRIEISSEPAINAATDLGLELGRIRGHVTYPGLADVVFDGPRVSGTEPETLPYSEAERLQQQDPQQPADPGLDVDVEEEVIDGLSLRRDVVVKDIGGAWAYLTGIDKTDPEYEDQGLGLPYQLPTAGTSEFRSFYPDYKVPSPPHLLTWHCEVQGADKLKVQELGGGTDLVFISGTAEISADGVVDDYVQDLSRVRPGDVFSVSGTDYVVVDVLSPTRIRIDSGAPAGSAVPYQIRILPAPGDYVFVRGFDPAPDYGLGLREGDILVVDAVANDIISVSDLYGRTLNTVAATSPVVVADFVRAALPFALADEIDPARVYRGQHGLVIGADDVRLEDSVSVTFLLPEAASATVTLNGVDYVLGVGEILDETTDYSGDVAVTGPVDVSQAVGTGAIIAANKFEADTNLFAEGVRPGDFLNISNSVNPANNGQFQILGFSDGGAEGAVVLVAGVLTVEVPENTLHYSVFSG